MPDGSMPGSNQPPAQASGESEVASATVDLNPGDWLHISTVGGRELWYGVDTNGREWSVVRDVATGDTDALLIHSPTAYDPATAPGVQANFQPDAGKWSVAWNPDTQVWRTFPPGTSFAAGVSGKADGDWNVVILPSTQPAGGSAATASAVAAAGPVRTGTTVTYDPVTGITTVTTVTPNATIVTTVGPNGEHSMTVTPNTPNPTPRGPLPRLDPPIPPDRPDRPDIPRIPPQNVPIFPPEPDVPDSPPGPQGDFPIRKYPGGGVLT